MSRFKLNQDFGLFVAGEVIQVDDAYDFYMKQQGHTKIVEKAEGLNIVNKAEKPTKTKVE